MSENEQLMLLGAVVLKLMSKYDIDEVSIKQNEGFDLGIKYNMGIVISENGITVEKHKNTPEQIREVLGLYAKNDATETSNKYH